MKTLANCKPTEFLKQTNRIKKSVERWLTDTDILNIRKATVEPAKILPDMGEEEKKAAFEDFRARREAKVRENLSKILDAVLDEHPDETLEVLALVCFVEPEDVDNHTMSDYLAAITEMLADESVMGFFTLLARLGLQNT